MIIKTKIQHLNDKISISLCNKMMIDGEGTYLSNHPPSTFATNSAELHQTFSLEYREPFDVQDRHPDPSKCDRLPYKQD